MISRMAWGALCLCLLITTSLFLACFSADKDPDERSDGAADDGADDDGGQDDAADDTGDDAADDAGDDDADDDVDDDTGQIQVDCGAITSFVYENCQDSFAVKPDLERLSQAEAENECGAGGAFWECVQVCLDAAQALDEGQCPSLIDCVQTQCTEGSLVLIDVP